MLRAKSDKKIGPRERKTYRLNKKTIKKIGEIAKVNEWSESEAVEKGIDHFYNYLRGECLRELKSILNL